MPRRAEINSARVPRIRNEYFLRISALQISNVQYKFLRFHNTRYFGCLPPGARNERTMGEQSVINAAAFIGPRKAGKAAEKRGKAVGKKEQFHGHRDQDAIIIVSPFSSPLLSPSLQRKQVGTMRFRLN